MCHSAEAKGILLECHTPEQRECIVLGDEGRQRQVLINLIGNAIKFTDRGSVKLLVEKGRGAINRHSFSFRITDTGIGISKETQQILFSAFTQADGSTTRRYGGTGLGLAISIEDANIHGGSLKAYSKPNEGATFRLTIPRRQGMELGASPLPLGPKRAKKEDS